MRNGKVLVKVTEDSMGNILVSPVNQVDRDYVSLSNAHDGSHEVYLQTDHDRQWFIESYPKSRYRITKSEGEFWGGYQVGKLWYFVNDGVKFYIDEWEFRHMVGGQSD